MDDILSAAAPTQYTELVNAATSLTLPSDYYAGSDDQYYIEGMFSVSASGKAEFEGACDTIGYDEAQSVYVNAVVDSPENIDPLKAAMDENINDMIETGEIENGECYADGNVVWIKLNSRQSI